MQINAPFGTIHVVREQSCDQINETDWRPFDHVTSPPELLDRKSQTQPNEGLVVGGHFSHYCFSRYWKFKLDASRLICA